MHRCLEMELDVNQANGFVLGMKINDGKERAIKQELCTVAGQWTWPEENKTKVHQKRISVTPTDRTRPLRRE